MCADGRGRCHVGVTDIEQGEVLMVIIGRDEGSLGHFGDRVVQGRALECTNLGDWILGDLDLVGCSYAGKEGNVLVGHREQLECVMEGAKVVTDEGAGATVVVRLGDSNGST
jgi:hypothetical protein